MEGNTALKEECKREGKGRKYLKGRNGTEDCKKEKGRESEMKKSLLED